MSVCIFPTIERALALGHDDPRIDRRRKDCKAPVRAAPCPRREPRERRDGGEKKPKGPTAAETFRAEADDRNRAETRRAVRAASDLPEPHPELTAQTIHGCRVFFCESAEYEEPVSVAEWWRMIARPGFE